MFEVEYFQLSSAQAAARAVALDGTPVSAGNVALDTIGGTSQALNGDFGVAGNIITWNDASFGLYSQLSSGDNLRVIYDRS